MHAYQVMMGQHSFQGGAEEKLSFVGGRCHETGQIIHS